MWEMRETIGEGGVMDLSPAAYAIIDAWLFGLALIGLVVLGVVVVWGAIREIKGGGE